MSNETLSLNRTLTAVEQDEWNRISGEATAIGESLSSLTLSVVQSKILGDAEKHKVLDWLMRVESALSGLPYFCTPQSEWLGGEKWAVRPPHIAR